ncbi:MAG TPA: YafY family transcriptional regulator, partial [Ruminococcaceae bacterium]|nr:YafY family transcriptional regulator [Oscillospiraceae bacterium]
MTITDERFVERDFLANVPNPIPESHQKPDVTLKLKIASEMTYRVYDEFDENFTEKQSDG